MLTTKFWRTGGVRGIAFLLFWIILGYGIRFLFLPQLQPLDEALFAVNGSGFHSAFPLLQSSSEKAAFAVNETNTSVPQKSSCPALEKYHIAYTPGWDVSPVVIESHKLIFFTIPKISCTVWKMLFRRMMNYSDWKTRNPHDPGSNGLKYLHHYSLEKANKFMALPDYIKAIFVRDPKERFLSAYLDKVKKPKRPPLALKCCFGQNISECVQEMKDSIENFFDRVQRGCIDAHWQCQHLRIEEKFWPCMDFVGNIETAETDARALLEHIGAWDKFGKTGWGPNGTSAIFSINDASHKSNASEKLQEFYTPELEKKVEEFYGKDYANPVLKLTKTSIFD